MAEEKTFSVGVQTSSPKRISVTSNVSENPITASADTGLYYSQLAKNWAIGEGLIQNEDYSSKTWAGESKSSADLSKMYSEAASLDLTNLENKIIEYDEQLNTTITEGLDNINTTVTSGVETIETLQDDSIAEITTNKETALSDIGINKTNTLAQISALANTSISDINAVGKSYDNLTYRNITNCLLEVPQRIKLELNDGVLTLKAGSEVIVPNGFEADGTTPKFDEIILKYDKVIATTGGSGTCLIAISADGNSYTSSNAIANCVSGAGVTHKNYGLCYDTSTNIIERWGNGVVAFKSALPLAQVTQIDGVITSVDQVFNGFGYIGSTFWVDKGVKGLIPNGRNEDGSLNNTEVTTTKIITRDLSDILNTSQLIGITKSGRISRTTIFGYSYDEINNLNYSDILIWETCVIGRVHITNSVITSLEPKFPFRAIDYSDSSTVSGWGMPSSKYINLTLGASGTLYTAPANGWFSVHSTTTMNGMFNYEKFGGATGVTFAFYSSLGGRGMLPVSKGDVVKFSYTGTPAGIRFIYAQGEV